MKRIFCIYIMLTANYCYSQKSEQCIAYATYSVYNYDNKISLLLEKTGSQSKIIFNNGTKDTVFLFSSYFKKDYYQSKYINRLDKRNKKIKASFLPLIPYLSLTKSDRIIIGEKSLITKGQILYEFIPIPPQSSYSQFVDSGYTIDKLTKDFDIKKIHLLDRIKFKTKENCEKSNYSHSLEFAIYKSIEGICNVDKYYNQTFEADSKLRDYEIFEVIVPK